MEIKIEEKVNVQIESIIKELGFEIEYIEYIKEMNGYILRVVLDKIDSTVTVEDCETVSRAIEEKVDICINNEYILEVSSPGVERELKNINLYKKYIGKEIALKLFKKLEDKKEFIGKLVEVNEKSINILIDDKNINIEIKDITSAHTVYDFSNVLSKNKKMNLNKLNKF